MINRSPVFELACNDHRLALGKRTRVMGILNVTPDSFSDGGKYVGVETACRHAEQMVAEGADIIDIGGESTRPFSDAVSEAEEIDRVIPIIEMLAGRIPTPISIDTTKARVAREAIAVGASMVNDISALKFDPEMAGDVAAAGIPVVLMHMKGRPKDMQTEPVYENVIEEVFHFLEEAIARAVQQGISKDNIIVDPGIGFGKTFSHNFLILNQVEAFHRLGVPVLVGSSRKAFIRNALRPSDGQDLAPEHPLVETGTQATVAAAALKGIQLLRCHNVAQTKATLAIIDAMRNSC